MNMDALQEYYVAGYAKVSVKGAECGTLFIVATLQQMEIPISSKSPDMPKTLEFRSAESAIRRLEKAGVFQYTVDLSKWDKNKIFDRNRHTYQKKRSRA